MLAEEKQAMQKQQLLPNKQEELSIDQQRKNSVQDTVQKKENHKTMGDLGIPVQDVKNLPKDTRTDAQKMTDATDPRPGSRYRGD